MMLFFICFTIFIFLCGVAVGAGPVRDHLDGIWTWPSKPVVRRQALPIARALHASGSIKGWVHTTPAVWRRKGRN